MNKKLISVAVGAALAAGTVIAQAAEESMAPTVYGKIHMSYGAVSDKGDETNEPTVTNQDNIAFRSHASRLGVKGALPVSDALKATYQLEYEVDPDAGGTAGPGASSSANLKRRNQYIGLKGGFGEVRFGRHDTPTKSYQGKFDEFNDTDADIKGVLNMSQAELRIDNVIAYLSPDFSGFSFAAAIAPSEGNGCKESTNADSTPACNANMTGADEGNEYAFAFGGDGPADNISLAAGYKMAGLFVSLGYDSYDDKFDPGYKDLMRLIATYGNKMFQVGAMYEAASGNADVYVDDKTVMGLSGHVSFADVHKIKLQYMMGENDYSGADANGAKVTVGEEEETQMSIGYDFKMGKSTTAYAMYTQANNKFTDKAQFGGGSFERKYSFIGIGMIQNF